MLLKNPPQQLPVRLSKHGRSVKSKKSHAANMRNEQTQMKMIASYERTRTVMKTIRTQMRTRTRAKTRKGWRSFLTIETGP